MSGYGETTCLWVVPFSELWNSEHCPCEFDLEKSRALLNEAGYPNLELEFPFVNVAEHPAIKDLDRYLFSGKVQANFPSVGRLLVKCRIA